MSMPPSPDGQEARDDNFLRGLAWWLCGSAVYLQFLSLAHLLSYPLLTAVPLMAVVAVFLFRWGKSRSLSFARTVPLELIVAAILISIIAVSRAIQPPRGYDVMAYHLPYIVEWMRAGWAVPYYSAFSGPVGYYPGNLELLALAFLSPTSSAYLLNAINLFSYLLIAGVVWAGAKRVNVRPALAVLVFTLLMVTSSVTLTILGNAYNDLFLAAALIAAWYFSEEYFRRRRISDVWLSGLMIGLAMGTKYAGLMYGAVFLVYFVIRAHRVKPVVVAAVALLIPCSYWYIRNYLITGNPIYPQSLTLFGHELLSGINRSGSEQLLITYATDPQFMRQFLRALVTYGHWLLLPLLIVFPWRRFKRPALLSYWIAGLVCLVIYLTMPLSAEDYNHVYLNYRYALPFQWMVMIAGGLAVLSALPLKKIEDCLAQRTVSVSRSLAGSMLTVVIVGGFFVYQSGYAARLPDVNFKLGHSWAFVETLPPSRIAHAGWDVSGALYGSHFQHSVYYINLNWRNGSNYHEYIGQDHRANADFEAWWMNLDAARIDVLWIFRHAPSIEREWVKSRPEIFPVIYEDESVKIVRVSGIGSDETYRTAFH